jgi:hypothetical protein
MDPMKKIVPFLTFALLASPQAFLLVRSLLGGWVATTDGLPKVGGLLLHALVFVVLTHFLWQLIYGQKKVSGCGCGN